MNAYNKQRLRAIDKELSQYRMAVVLIADEPNELAQAQDLRDLLWHLGQAGGLIDHLLGESPPAKANA